MKKLPTLAVILLTTAISSHAQSVYSWGIYSMGRTYEGQWVIGKGATRFGLEQYREYQDANGKRVIDIQKRVQPGVTDPRFTEVYCGPLHFRVRGPAYMVAALAGIGVMLLSWLGLSSVKKIRRIPPCRDDK